MGQRETRDEIEDQTTPLVGNHRIVLSSVTSVGWFNQGIPRILFNDVWITEFCHGWIIDCQDVKSSGPSETNMREAQSVMDLVPQLTDSRTDLWDPLLVSVTHT